jgi:hypothetical protein
LRLKGTWRERASIWASVVAPSGSTKSPAFGAAARPLYAIEREARDRHEYELQQWKEREGAEHERPIRERYRTGDPTPEAVVKLLRDNERTRGNASVTLARDELAAWIGSFDRYTNGAADLQFWIEIWGGIQVSRDRAGDGNVTVDNPACSVLGTIQPGTLKEKLGEIHFDTGFASRLLLVMPPPRRREWTEADVTRETADAYESLLTRLYDLAPGAEVRLGTDAKRVWVDFYNRANADLATRSDGPACAVAAKGITYVARLALVLHLARREAGETAADEVDEATMRAAVRLGTWLRDETLRVYRVLGLDAEAVPPVVRFLRALPDAFTTAEAQTVAETLDIPRRTMFEWLSTLCEDGALRKIRRGRYEKPGAAA